MIITIVFCYIYYSYIIIEKLILQNLFQLIVPNIESSI